ncbi:hypothetical protein BV898_00622 [Hypsibius exemplaris]|uniref:PKD domain-containing protein n=1 Tax=Hypsibius exemplaris TaxID=2072580 RepID=A0A1W0XE96_HYPEX|nr:hypothetical protein BV898_00622 [Hypsibius exemplaris]
MLRSLFVPCLATVWLTVGECYDRVSSASACAPVFHSRYGMWTDPCHAIVHVARNWHVNLKCNGPLGLSIVGAKYGPLCSKVDTSNKCVDACQSVSVVENVRQVCGSNKVFECRVSARDVLFVNPCPQLPPVLAISFTCDYPVYSFVPGSQKKMLSLKQWGGGWSSTCECGGGSYDGRKKRALFGAEDLAVWSNTRSAIQFFNSTFDVIQFSGIFNEVDLCPAVVTTPSPINQCATLNSAGPVLYSNGLVQPGAIPDGLCRSMQQVAVSQPCACGTTATGQCFTGERCCTYETEPFCASASTTTTITTTIPTNTTTTTTTPRPRVLAITTSQTTTTCSVSPTQTGEGPSSSIARASATTQPFDPAGTVAADGGTPPYTWAITSTDGNFVIDPSSGGLSVNAEKYLTAGTYSVTVLVRDASGMTAQRQISIQACANTQISYSP